jgi:GT2 family glycosyltransferase
VDWCLRARAADFRVVYAGTAAIVHKGAANSGPGQGHQLLTWYILGRNGLLIARRHGRWAQRMRFALLCTAAFAGRLMRAMLLRVALGSPATRARGATLWAMEVAFARGVVDGLRGHPIPFAQLGAAGAALRREAV